MPGRQLALFRIGCWTAIITAVVHLAGQIAGPAAPANDTEAQLMSLAATYRVSMPGGAERSLMDFLTGFSLAFALLLAVIGATGLVVAKRGQQDPVLMSAVARVFAASGVALLVISMYYWFLIPSLCIATMAFAFLLASVRAPVPADGRT